MSYSGCGRDDRPGNRMEKAVNGQWTLKGIEGRKTQCEQCGRHLTNCFKVTDPNGAERIVGRECCKKMTGFNWSVRQAQIAQRNAEREAAARAKWGDAGYEAVEGAGRRWQAEHPNGDGGEAAEVMCAMKGGEACFAGVLIGDAQIAAFIARQGVAA